MKNVSHTLNPISSEKWWKLFLRGTSKLTLMLTFESTFKIKNDASSSSKCRWKANFLIFFVQDRWQAIFQPSSPLALYSLLIYLTVLCTHQNWTSPANVQSKGNFKRICIRESLQKYPESLPKLKVTEGCRNWQIVARSRRISSANTGTHAWRHNAEGLFRFVGRFCSILLSFRAKFKIMWSFFNKVLRGC